jgi:hypothetical protein
MLISKEHAYLLRIMCIELRKCLLCCTVYRQLLRFCYKHLQSTEVDHSLALAWRAHSDAQNYEQESYKELFTISREIRGSKATN